MRNAPLRAISRPPCRWWFGAACFDEASLVLTQDGVPVELERRPLELLALLLANAGEVVTKGEIVAVLWEGREITDAALTKCVARLRRALADTDHAIVLTVHGYGYRFAAPVRMECAADAPAAPGTIALVAGDEVPGRPGWHLVRPLGSGGHGDVWLTEHAIAGERRVIKFARDEAGTVALRREVTLGRLLREALGRRDDIVRVLDWNLEAPPFFVETAWSEPGNLADWAVASGGLATLALSLRVDLVAQIADALASAHGVGVLHKDLKPANILMRTTAQGRPGIVLTDFGSGRAIDPARLDAFGITRLDTEVAQGSPDSFTRMYQAPELASGAMPTVQADIFALGVILYQLAAGDLRRPLAPGWEADVADPLLREDIALAASGDPARRLATAAELAARLRCLSERRAEAVRAQAASDEAARLRQALQTARVRRGPMRALGGALLLGFAVSTVLYIRAERAGHRAKQEAARAHAVTSFLTDDLFSAANPVLGANPNVPVKAVLSAAAAELDRKFAPGGLDRATLEAAIGGAFAGLADPAHARPLLDSALATFARQLGAGSAQAQAVRLVEADLAERVADLDALRRAARDILAAHPTDADTELRARFALRYADCLDTDTDNACVAALRPLLAEVERRTGPSSLLALRVDDLLAYQLAEGQHFDAAIPLARHTVALGQALFGADSLHTQERRYHLAIVLEEAGQREEAVATLVDVRRRLLALSGTETELTNRVATQLGRAYAETGHFDAAVPLLRDALAFTERVHGEGYEITRHCLNLLAKALSGAGQDAEAIRLGQRALDLERAAHGTDNEDVLWIEGNLAEEYRKAGDLARAEAIYADVVARAHHVFTPTAWDVGHFEMLLGAVLVEERKTEAARAALAASVDALTRALGPTDARTRDARAMLAEVK